MKKMLCMLLAFVFTLMSVFGAYAAKSYTVKPVRVVLYTSLSSMRVGQTREISYELTWPRLRSYLSQNEGLSKEDLLQFATTAGTAANLTVKVAIDRTEWSSDNPDIAEVSEYGEVTAHAPGVVTITLSLRGPNSEGKTVELASEDIEITVTEKRDIDNLDRYLPQRTEKSAAEPEKNYAGGEISAKDLVALVKKSAKVTVRNAGQVSAETLRAAATAATESAVKATINFDTMSGSSVGGRVTLNPDISAEMKGDIKLGVASTGKAIDDAAAKVKHVYKNRVVIVKAEQAAWGGAVRYAVKSGLNYVRARDLVLYSLNPETGECTAIAGDAQITTDTSGYVHFTTARGGWLLLSDGALEKWNYGGIS